MKKQLLVLIITILPFIAVAQMRNAKEVESFKIAWLTEKMELSSEEAKVFWPIYNAYQAEQRNLRTAHHSKMASGRKITEIEEMSDAEVQALITNELDFKTRDLNIEKKYYARFKSTLPARTLAKFYRAQETFKRALLERYRPKPRN